MPSLNHTWALKAVNVNGVVQATFTQFRIDEIVWELNGFGSATFGIRTLDANADKFTLLNREPSSWHEVQMWRDGLLLWWGIPVRADGQAGWTTIKCVGLLWYYSRGFFGPNTSQFLTNPHFELGVSSSWSATGTTATASTAVRLLGTQSAKLVEASAGQDSYLVQTYNITPGGGPGFQYLFDVCAWVYVEDAAWIGPALEERGLHVQSRHIPFTVFNQQVVPINNDTPRNQWVKLLTKIAVASGVTSTVEVRLYSPGGTVYWDATAVKNSGFIGASPPADLGTVVLANIAGGLGALNVAVSCASVGISEDRQYRTEDNGNAWQAITEWPARNISDVEMVFNVGGTSRTFTSWAPRKGTFRADRPISIAAGSITPRQWSWEVDLTQSASAVRVIGPGGSGPTREYGYAVDATTLGNVNLEQVIAAPSDATIGVLDTVATTELARTKRPVRIPSLTVPADPYLDLALGDTLAVTANWGWLQDPGTIYRVVGKKLVPKDDALTLYLNLP